MLGLGLALAGALVWAVVLRPTPARPAGGRCLSVPRICGFPDAANTGVPAGMTLLTVPGQVSSGPGWHFDSRGWVEVTGDGAVLSGLYIPHDLDIRASNVTVKGVRVVNSGRSSFGISLRHTSNVTIEDSTISGRNAGNGRLMVGVKDIYADSTGLRVLRNDIAQTGTGVQMESGLIAGNYIHAMGYLAGDHVNGITSDGGGAGLLTIRHNTILTDRGQTDAIGLFEDSGVQANRVIAGNLLAGGGYTIYAGQNAGGPATRNIAIMNNRISTVYYPHGGHWGPATAFNARGKGDIWAGNVWAGNGHLIPDPARAGPRHQGRRSQRSRSDRAAPARTSA
jgi:hypothetical protein